MGISGQFGIENYRWKVGIIQKTFAIIANFPFVFFYMPNFPDTPNSCTTYMYAN